MYDTSCRIFIDVLYWVEEFPAIPSLVRIFEWMFNLSNAFLHVLRCSCGFSFLVNKVLTWIWFWVLKSWRIPRINPTWPWSSTISCTVIVDLLKFFCEFVRALGVVFLQLSLSGFGSWVMLVTAVYLPTRRAPVCLRPWQHLVLSAFSILQTSCVWDAVALLFQFSSPSPSCRGSWQHCVLTAVGGYPSVKCLFMSFCPVFFWIFLWICRNSVYILLTIPL